MYKHKQNQRGASHLFLVIIVLLAIAGGVGYLFWSNVINKSENKQDNNQKATIKESSDAKAVKMKQGQTVGFPVTVSWSYPETWSMKREGYEEIIKKGDQDTHGQMITLSSPSKGFEVVYNLYYNGGFGGACPEGDIQHIEKQKSDYLQNTYFINAIVDSYSFVNNKSTFEGYRYTSGLMKNDTGKLPNLKVGDKACEISFGNLMQLGTDPNISLQTRIGLNSIYKYDQEGSQIAIKDMQTIKDQYAKDEYKDAVKILLSTAVK